MSRNPLWIRARILTWGSRPGGHLTTSQSPMDQGKDSDNIIGRLKRLWKVGRNPLWIRARILTNSIDPIRISIGVGRNPLWIKARILTRKNSSQSQHTTSGSQSPMDQGKDSDEESFTRLW